MLRNSSLNVIVEVWNQAPIKPNNIISNKNTLTVITVTVGWKILFPTLSVKTVEILSRDRSQQETCLLNMQTFHKQMVY